MDQNEQALPDWTQTAFMRSLLSRIGVPMGASEQTQMAAVFAAILHHAQELLSDKPGRPTADEVASEVLSLALYGSCGANYRNDQCPIRYLRGLIRRKGLAFDSKHRRRETASLDAQKHDCASSASGPLEVAIQREQIELVRTLWPKLTQLQRRSIRAELGPAFMDGPGCSDATIKNYMAKFHGIEKLKKLLD